MRFLVLRFESILYGREVSESIFFCDEKITETKGLNRIRYETEQRD